MSRSKKVIHSQGREIIYDVYKFMRTEKEQQALTILLSNLQERVAKSCRVGTPTVKSGTTSSRGLTLLAVYVFLS